MTYRPHRRLFVQGAAVSTAGEARSVTASSAFRGWRALDPDGKLEAVDRALDCAANHCCDSLPIAL